MHRKPLIKGGQVSTVFAFTTQIQNTADRHANLIGKVQSFSKGIFQYVEMLQIFTNKVVPAFTTAYFLRIVKKG